MYILSSQSPEKAEVGDLVENVIKSQNNCRHSLVSCRTLGVVSDF